VQFFYELIENGNEVWTAGLCECGIPEDFPQFGV
jgi:hypothetical protein